MYGSIFTIVFMWSLVTICAALLIIQMQLVLYFCISNRIIFVCFIAAFDLQFYEIFSFIQVHQVGNLAVLLKTILEVIYPFGVLFTMCELAHRYIQAFDECDEMVDQFDWYIFPVKIQRMMPLILNFTQQSNEIKCFGSAACNREAFKYVSTTKDLNKTTI